MKESQERQSKNWKIKNNVTVYVKVGLFIFLVILMKCALIVFSIVKIF